MQVTPVRPSRALPRIIQGGMGIGVSGWPLARAVSARGHLGVVSGTCIDTLLVRRLQDGDVGGHVRRALGRFPLPEVSAAVLERYFQPAGRGGAPYALLPMWRPAADRAREQLTVLAAFVEVHLAREGHDGPVGINLLTKVQLPNLATLFGAMLAGVDCVLMGAGIPREIPGVLDRFARGEPACLHLDVEGVERAETVELRFDPAPYLTAARLRPAAGGPGRDGGAVLGHDSAPAPDPAMTPLARPRFLPIVSSHALALVLARKASGRVDGFVVEGPTAGGHNAPPRGQARAGSAEPVYGERDRVDLGEMRALGLPFWLAGGTGSPEALARALDEGAAGVQVGTLFAFSEESGLDPELKRRALARVRAGNAAVRTDGRASPTGFPFKVAELEGTNAQPEQYARRARRCDLGYLRSAFRRADGRIDFRCPAEPVDTYVKKGGGAEETVGRSCLCNGLFANIGHGQVTADGVERPLLTAGDDLARLGRFLGGRAGYSAAEVLDYLLSAVEARASAPVGAPAIAAD